MADASAKPFYASKTLWVNLFAAVGGLAESQGWINTSISGDVQIALLALVNALLRILTKDSVSLSPK